MAWGEARRRFVGRERREGGEPGESREAGPRGGAAEPAARRRPAIHRGHMGRRDAHFLPLAAGLAAGFLVAGLAAGFLALETVAFFAAGFAAA